MLELPDYDFDGLLHDSGSSVLYRAHRHSDGMPVVIKQPRSKPATARMQTRYRNEYEILSSLSHDRVTKVYDLVRHDGHVALILEYFSGMPLKSWLKRANPSLVDRLKLAIELTTTLGYVHSAGVIHKDVNSQNILVSPEQGQSKLIDFGFATRLHTEETNYQSATSLEGTLAYIAPEQTGRMNRSTDYRADLYSLGVTLYELFSGRLPHESDDPLESVHFHIAGKPTPIDEFDNNVPAAVSDIVMMLLRKEPEDRYQSAIGIAGDLRNCVDQLQATGSICRFELATADVIDSLELPQRLYGRKCEKALLLDAFERVAHGGAETILVAGDAGVGKTSLVGEIYGSVTRRRGYFASGRFDQLRQDAPFSAIVDALQGLVRQLLTESEESLVAWREAILGAVGVNGQIIIEVIPALELIIGPQPEVPALAATEAQNRFILAFHGFIQALAWRSRSLVLFLDDMQWADAASLKLVMGVLCAPATRSLLVVQAYRNNEISAGHPFMMTIKELEARGVHVGSVELLPLAPADVARFIADALRVDSAAASLLAETMHKKTGGNPFFLRQFLQSIYADELIKFDPDKRAFSFDSSAIEAAEITENVAGLLTTELERLPASTCSALKRAAAIGMRFDLETLSAVNQTSISETAVLLRSAVDERLIIPTSSLESLDAEAFDSPLVYRHFKFLHDRIQQAAYNMIPPAERPCLHLAIGRALLDKHQDRPRGQMLFDIVNHMNQGAGFIDEPGEKLTLARLDLSAGIKARNSAAYDLAVECYSKTLELLGGDSGWTDHPELVRDTRLRLAEGYCLTADHDAAFRVIDESLRHAVSPMERAQLFALRVSTYSSMGKLPEALACGCEAAESFGMQLPADAERAGQLLNAEIGSILQRTKSIGIGNLLTLPPMKEPDRIAFMTLLTHCLPAAYQTNQQLFALICCNMVSLSLESGNCPLSARAYGSFAALLSSMFTRHSEAYQFAKLAVDLAHEFEDASVYSGVYFLFAAFASHWQEPVDASIDLYAQSVHFGLQTGDHAHTAYSAERRICHLQFRGMPLDELHAEAAAARELQENIGDLTNSSVLETRMRFIKWLQDARQSKRTLDSDSQTEAELTAVIEAGGNHSYESDWFMLLTMQRYMCGEFEQAAEFARKAESLLAYSAAFVTRAEHNLYYALAISFLLDTASAQQQEGLREEFLAQHAQLKEWAATCPPNYKHMFLLVEAERARHGDSPLEAMHIYDQAIDAAATQGFSHIEALAAELAARFWLEFKKPEFFGLYMSKAVEAYEVWGATRKVAELAATLRLAAGRENALSTVPGSMTISSSTSGGDALDLATALKASQALAGEIVLEKLLVRMMDIVLENVGGERAVLILDSDGEFFIQGIKDITSGQAEVMLSEPLATTNALATGIVNYVIRTSEHVVLANPAMRGKFRNDPYVRSHQLKSVLSAPILHKGKLTGVIYIENNQVSGAFTPARLEALEILMSQIAVSIDNATLYAQLERQTHKIERANASLAQEIIERKKAEEELSQYKDHLEELVSKRTSELEKAQSKLVDISRRAGMAEVASGVLHNVGNVMNSVNVGANVVREAIKALRIEGLQKVCERLDANADNLAEYLGNDPGGSKIPDYLGKLASALQSEKSSIRHEMERLLEHLEHMKKIIAAQQSYAKTQGATELCTLDEIIEVAFEISDIGLRNARIGVRRDYGKFRLALLDRHQILQILINLISNSRHALLNNDPENRQLTVSASESDGEFRIEVVDNGIGISPQDMRHIFNHGFTTKKTGHGFGLHNCANAAQEMNGSLQAFSDGIGSGARLVLRLPVNLPVSHEREVSTG